MCTTILPWTCRVLACRVTSDCFAGPEHRFGKESESRKSRAGPAMRGRMRSKGEEVMEVLGGPYGGGGGAAIDETADVPAVGGLYDSLVVTLVVTTQNES